MPVALHFAPVEGLLGRRVALLVVLGLLRGATTEQKREGRDRESGQRAIVPSGRPCWASCLVDTANTHRVKSSANLSASAMEMTREVAAGSVRRGGRGLGDAESGDEGFTPDAERRAHQHVIASEPVPEQSGDT